MKLTDPQLRVLRLMRTGQLKQSRQAQNVYSIMGERIHQRTAASLISMNDLIECAGSCDTLDFWKLTALGREAAGEGT